MLAAISKRIEEISAALSRLSRREKYMLGGVLLSFVLFVGLLVSMLISSSLSRLEQRIATKTIRLQEILDLRQKYADAKMAKGNAARIIRQARNLQLMGTLENLAKQTGINTKEMQMSPRGSTVNPEVGIEEKKVEVSIPQITIDRLVEFLDQTERRSECIKVKTLHIRKNFKDPTKLDVEIAVSKYQQKQEKEGASPEGAPMNRP